MEKIMSDPNEVIQQFLNSDIGKKYQNYDSKSITRAFVNWAESQKIPTLVLHLAPKSSDGDSHVMPVVQTYAVDFAKRQHSSYNKPLVTHLSQVKSVYKKFGFFSYSPDWFDQGRQFYLGEWKDITTMKTDFPDELL
jgi:hypothetical protein